MLKKRFFLLFKNGWKDIIKNQIQTISLIILTFLSCAIFTTVSITDSRITNQYQYLNQVSNQQDFTLDFYNSNFHLNNGQAYKTSSLDEAAQITLGRLATSMKNSFYFDRIESRNFSIQNNNKTIKVVGYSNRQKIDKIFLYGDYQKYNFKLSDMNGDNRAALINKEFADKNNIKIGDIIRLQPDNKGQSILVKKDIPNLYQSINLNNFKNSIENSPYKIYNWFQVKGYGISANFETPIIDESKPLPNKLNEGIIYINNKYFGLSFDNDKKSKNYNTWQYDPNADKVSVYSNTDKEITYMGKAFNKNHINQIIKDINSKLFNPINKLNYYYTKDNGDNKICYSNNDSSYRFYNRYHLLDVTIKSFSTYSYLLTVIILVTTLVALILVIRKKIENQRSQLGVLKSLGYQKKELLISFIAYPLVISLLGGTLGFLIGIALQQPIINIFSNYFNLYYGQFSFGWSSWTYSIILLFLSMSLLVFVIVMWILRQNTISLIKNISNKKIPLIGILIKKIFKRRSFETRFKVSFFASSFGKMTAVFITMLVGTILLSVSTIGPMIIKDTIAGYNKNKNYNIRTTYNSPIWNNPTTFYTTYDPELSYWKPETINKKTYYTPSLDNIIDELKTGKINAQYYAPNINVLNSDSSHLSLSNLTWRNISKQYFTNYNINIKTDLSPTSQLVNYLSCKFAWPDYTNLNNNVNNKNDKTSVLPSLTETFQYNPNSNFDNINSMSNSLKIQDFKLLKNFYIKYSQSINLSINKSLVNSDTLTYNDIDNINKSKDNPNYKMGYFIKDKNNKIYTDPSWSQNKNFIIINNNNQLYNGSNIIKSKGELLNSDTISKYITEICDWYGVEFMLRGNQAILQGTYSRAPYFVENQMKKSYSNKNSNFNILFGINPFIPSKDNLGTYLNGSYKNNQINIYGVKQNTNLYTLTSNNKNINNKLFGKYSDNIYPIIINKSMSKKYDLTSGDVIEYNYNSKTLSSKDDKIKDFNIDNYDFNSINNDPDNSGYGISSTYMQKLKYNNINLYDPGTLGIAASNMEKNIHNQNYFNKNYKKSYKLKIVNVSDGYGKPEAYIANNNANIITQYNKSQRMLFQIFLNNMNSVKNIQGSQISKYNDLFNYIKSIINTSKNNAWLKANNDSKQKNKNAQELISLFNNAYPIYNYKVSKSNDIYDLTDGFSTTTPYGDYTLIGLNSGDVKSNNQNIRYNGHGEGATNNIIPKDKVMSLLDQVSSIAWAILILFIIISFIISFSIITLSTNLIMHENKKYISGLKVLGYNDKEATKYITGMYTPLILIAFIIGFPIAWFAMTLIDIHLAHTTSWILALNFYWWIPLISFIGIIGLYIITYIISWFNMSKIKAIEILYTK